MVSASPYSRSNEGKVFTEKKIFSSQATAFHNPCPQRKYLNDKYSALTEYIKLIGSPKGKKSLSAQDLAPPT